MQIINNTNPSITSKGLTVDRKIVNSPHIVRFLPELRKMANLANISIKPKVINTGFAFVLTDKVTVTPLEKRSFLEKFLGINKKSELCHVMFQNGTVLDVVQRLCNSLGIFANFSEEKTTYSVQIPNQQEQFRGTLKGSIADDPYIKQCINNGIIKKEDLPKNPIFTYNFDYHKELLEKARQGEVVAGKLDSAIVFALKNEDESIQRDFIPYAKTITRKLDYSGTEKVVSKYYGKLCENDNIYELVDKRNHAKIILKKLYIEKNKLERMSKIL